MIKDLITFVRGLNDGEEESEDLMLKIRNACLSTKATSPDTVDAIYNELERAFRMFYLQQQMKGLLREFKEDHFI